MNEIEKIRKYIKKNDVQINTRYDATFKFLVGHCLLASFVVEYG